MAHTAFRLTVTGLLLATTGCGVAGGDAWIPVYDEPKHRLVFENDDVMILDVNLPPGYTSLYHQHVLDVLYVTVSGTEVWAQPLGGDRRYADVATGDLRFSSDNHPLPHIHRVGNVGSASFHVIGVGVKSAGGQHRQPPLEGDIHGMEKVDDKPHASVYRIRLLPGEHTGSHRHRSSVTRVFRTAGTLRDPDGNLLAVKAADFLWQPAGVTHRYENAGTEAIEIVEILAR